MKLNKLALLVFLAFTGCCQDQIVSADRLTEFEKTLIPNTPYQKVDFIDNEGNVVIGTRQPKKVRVETERPGPESCDLWQYEKETKDLDFFTERVFFEIELNSWTSTDFRILVSSENRDIYGYFKLGCRDLYNLSIEERFTDVTVNEFYFQNVMVFFNCTGSSGIERIIFSPVNGIEYIEFSSGDWWKLESGVES